jgi:hypothetical protein
MVGWDTALNVLTRERNACRSRFAWNLVTLSLVTWFTPDTLYLLLSGSSQSAVLNTASFGLLAASLAAPRPSMREEGRAA